MKKETQNYQLIDEVFSRGLATFIDPDQSFQKKIQGKIDGTYTKDIIVKFGVDPTRPDLHLGHALILWRLRKLQDVGCKIVFLAGDYTTLIGDPTGKSRVRPELNQKEIEQNMKTYIVQVQKILRTDPAVFSWIRNADWFTAVSDIEPKEGIIVRIMNRGINPRSFVGKAILFAGTRMQKTHLKKNDIISISLTTIMRTLRKITHARLIERDMFQERLNSGSELYMHEMLYPVLQGLDSYVISRLYGSCDMEVGGTDQTFNMLMGRDVMKMNQQDAQAVASFVILEGLDGSEKMSKSLDNYIAVNDAPRDMYGKVMSIPDTLIIKFFMLATFTSSENIERIEKEMSDGILHPKKAKMNLAHQIVALYYGEDEASDAGEAFEKTFSAKEIPKDVPVVVVKKGTILSDVMVDAKIVSSKAEFRRLVIAGAIEHMETKETLTNVLALVSAGTYRIGKRRFLKITHELDMLGTQDQ